MKKFDIIWHELTLLSGERLSSKSHLENVVWSWFIHKDALYAQSKDIVARTQSHATHFQNIRYCIWLDINGFIQRGLLPSVA